MTYTDLDRARQVRYRETHREEIRERKMKTRSARTPEEAEVARAYNRAYYEANREVLREKWLANRYGITKTQYDAMWEEQDGCCAICNDPFEDTKNSRIDHDHSCCAGIKSCGRCVRGLLCQLCNSGLGYFRDSPRNMLNAVEYLDQGTTVV